MTSRSELAATCTQCGAQPGRPCRTATGRPARTHTFRRRAAMPAPTPEELAERARDQRIHDAEWASSVRTQFVLSCGCEEPVSEPIPISEWPVTTPGAVASCDVHHEYAIVTEVRTRLVADIPTLTRLYRAAGLDKYDAEELAEQQADEEPVPA